MGITFSDNLLRALSWTFIHSLWQGLLLAVLAGIIMLATKRHSASVRYALLCLLFFLFLAGVTGSFLFEWYAGTNESPADLLTGNDPGVHILISHPVLQQLADNATFLLNENAQWIVSAWLFILFIKLTRMLLDMLYVHRLRNHKIISAGDGWQQKLQLLADEMGIRKKVSLIESALVKIPVVVGHFKPVVLVPLGILAQLPAGEIEAVLLHELAHIRRHDYLVNFMQRMAELLFFFNPGLLWVSSLLKIEREHCCDDMAIARTQNKLQFVEALISFKEYSMKRQGYALALFGKRNLLLQRMNRIVHNSNKTLSPFEVAFIILSCIMLLFLLPGVRSQQVPEQIIAAYSDPAADTIMPIAAKQDRETQPVAGKKFTGNNTAQHTGIAMKKPVSAIQQAPVANRQGTQEQASEALLLAKQQMEKDRAEQDRAREQVANSRIEMEKNRLHAEHSRQTLKEQQEKDREQFRKDMEQQAKDQIQFKKDMEQREKDQVQFRKDMEEFNKNSIQASKNARQAAIDLQAARLQQEKDRQYQAALRKQYEIDRLQAEKDRQQADRMRAEMDAIRTQAVKS